ncbi:phage holin family protein [Lampropedia puyangensis]|uniref:phage holin family protein n=1 Tax=Lampropedia puyangensis TaxID=1330072 RepID=UPI00130532BF|nr:phage holin family protein [Lampropedia puyangensis]
MAIQWQSLLGLDRFRESARYWVDESSIALSDRLELARLEGQKQFSAIVGLIVAAALLLMLLFGALIVGSFMVLLSWWQTPQWGTALAWIAGAWGVALLVAIVAMVRMVKKMAQPFVLTRQVLAQDFRDLKERL